jgi:hypothetical protein
MSIPPGASPGGASAPPGNGVAGTGAGSAGMMTTPSPGSGGSVSVPVMKGPPVGTGSTCLQPGNGDYLAPGPYQVAKMDVDLGMIEANQDSGKYTIYYPNPLETNCLHPIVAWGNGTGVTDSDFTYDFLNSNAASWGMVVASSADSNTGSGAFHRKGVDYLLMQNEDPSSMFYKHLTTRAGIAGHSQGGFGTVMAFDHPNVVTAVIEGSTGIANDKVSLLIMTGTMDIVSGAEQLVTQATGPMFVADWEGGDHFSTETALGVVQGDKGTPQFARLYAAWFRCFLADDAVACKLFSGGTPSGCGICKDPGWHALASNNL